MKQIKELLKDKLTQKELSLVPSSFDIVGSILIFSEFPEELIKKEKIIAEAFLKELKNIKTICKKTKVYSGIYRTPKLKIITGEKTKETIHKENGVLLKLDVEKVYFSTRLSNERLRIAKLVQPEEEILVMFSGCGVYPCVISKNSHAKHIYGIEINPIGHKYAQENLKLNKIKNIELYCGDVKRVLPDLCKKGIALKSRWTKKHLISKLKENPDVIEFFVPEGDLENNKKYNQINKTIKNLSEKGIKVMIHLPFLYKGKDVSLSQSPADLGSTLECLNKVDYLKKINTNVIGFIVHAADGRFKQPHKKEWLIKNIKTLEENDLLSNIYLENNISSPFDSKKDILDIIKKTNLRNICFDFAHYLKMNKKLSVKDYLSIKSKINIYNHLANHNPQTNFHSSRLREGIIDFRLFAPYIESCCIEIYSQDEVKAKEQIEDYKWFLSIRSKKKFDRILMPLPRSAEDFLDLALQHAKKGTIIHFYDFLKEDEFDKTKEKVAKACKKAALSFKVLNLVKCGQFGPRIYRICLDFQIT